MDETRFDDLTRALAGAGSRRTLLRSLLGAAGLVAGAGGGKIAAAKRRHGSCASIDDCHPCQTCQIGPGQTKGACVPAADGAACGAECGVCESGHCRTDVARCGECQICDAKSLTCRPQCADGKLCCGVDCCNRLQNCCNDVCCDTGCIIGGEQAGECCPADKFCAGHLCCDADEECCGGECVLACDNGCEHDPDDCACGHPPRGMAFCPTLGLCRSTKCPRGQTFDPSTCRCECKHDGVACGAKCCAAGQACCNGQCCDHACAGDGSCSDCASGVRCDGQCCAADEYCNDGNCEYCPSGKTCSDSCCFHATDVCCNGGCWPVEGAPYAACAGSGICCANGSHCCDDGLSGCCADQ